MIVIRHNYHSISISSLYWVSSWFVSISLQYALKTYLLLFLWLRYTRVSWALYFQMFTEEGITNIHVNNMAPVIRPATSGVLLLAWNRFEDCFPHSHTLTSYMIIGHVFSLYLSLPCIYYLVCSMLSVCNVLSVHDTNNSYCVSAVSSFSPIKMQPSQYRSFHARLLFQAAFMCVLPVALAVLSRLKAYQSGVQ